MYAKVDKPKENKSRAVANSVAQKMRKGMQGFGFVDNRPKTGLIGTSNVLQEKLLKQCVVQLGKRDKKYKNEPSEFIGPQGGVHVHIYPNPNTPAVGHIKSSGTGQQVTVRNLDTANEAINFLNHLNG